MMDVSRIHAVEDRQFAETAGSEMRRLQHWFYETQSPVYPETPSEVVDAVIARFGEYRAYAEKTAALAFVHGVR